MLCYVYFEANTCAHVQIVTVTFNPPRCVIV